MAIFVAPLIKCYHPLAENRLFLRCYCNLADLHISRVTAAAHGPSSIHALRLLLSDAAAKPYLKEIVKG